MKRGVKVWVVAAGLMSVLFLAGGALAETACSRQELPESFSWYGESGALGEPVYDEDKGGFWWMPEKAPDMQEKTQWGNRGYIFVGTGKVTAPALELPEVYFALDSTGFTPAALQALRKNAAVLRKNPRVKVRLVGFTSPEGTAVYNKGLSERRAKAVKDYLVTREKIAPGRLETEGRGVFPVKERAGWPLARKVVFVVID